MQANVQRVYDWSLVMSMPLSIEKSIVFHCGADNPLRQYQCGTDILLDAANITDLGVIRSCDSSYREHVASVAQKGHRLIGQCFKALHSRDPAFMTQVYYTYILLYCFMPLLSGRPISGGILISWKRCNGASRGDLSIKKDCLMDCNYVTWRCYHSKLRKQNLKLLLFTNCSIIWLG
jgi:hypothetical protein